MKRIPIIIDCDPGIDDAIAIMLACASEELDVKAITTVAGNVTLDKTTQNALNILETVHADIPVAMGAAAPLCEELHTAGDFHGKDGMGDRTFPSNARKPVKMNAIALMEKVVSESEVPVTLVPLGPLTNIAGFFLACPHLIHKIERISMMGGAAYQGNCNPSAEFNIWVDPEAAQIVFSSDVPITMHGLDVTLKGTVTLEDIENLRQASAVGQVAAELLDYHKKLTNGEPKPRAIHDAHAIAWLLKPELYEYIEGYVRVDIYGQHTRGCTVVDTRPWASQLYPNKPKTKVVMEVDREGFAAMLIDALKRYE